MTFANPYSSVTVSGYNANPPSDDGTETSSNAVTWDNHKSKLGDPVKTAIESVNSNVNSAFSTLTSNLNTVDDRTTSYGQIGGLYIANNATDSEHDIDFSVGRCRDAADTIAIPLPSALSKRIDGTWVAGSGNGGLAANVSLSADTWYACHVIQDANGTVDAGFDNSSTATNLLTGSSYTKYRRVGWVKTDSSSNILGFHRVDDEYFWDSVSALDHNGTASNTSQNITLNAPPQVSMVNINLFASGDVDLLITNPAADDVVSSTTAAPLGSLFSPSSVAVTGGNRWVSANATPAIRVRNPVSMTLRIATVGWRDKRIL